MAKKKPTATAELIPRLIKFPKDWIEKVDQVRGDMPFSEFIRQAVLDKIGSKGLSQVGGWGGERKSTEG